MKILIFLVFITITVEKITGHVFQLGCDEIRTLVDEHNEIRLKVAAGGLAGQPPTPKMNMLVWDSDLAKKAETWAGKDKFVPSAKEKTDNDPCKTSKTSTGENIYMYSTTEPYIDVTMAVNSWAAESAYFTFSQNTTYNRNSTRYAGRYTQMVWASTKSIGCAMSKFPDKSTFKSPYFNFYIVCYYSPGGNIDGQAPYKSGEPSKKLNCATDACSCSRFKYGDKCQTDDDE